MKIIIILRHLRKTASFSFYHRYFRFYFTIEVRRLLLFNGVLFAQEIPKELILLCMDYDIVFRLKKC